MLAATGEAIVVRTYGGPEIMRLEPVTLPEVAAGELLIRQSVASVNFHDIYVRTGSYRTLQFPCILGIKAVGTVEAIGERFYRLRSW